MSLIPGKPLDSPGPLRELRESHAELLAACKLAQSYYSVDMNQPAARAIHTAIANAEAIRFEAQ